MNAYTRSTRECTFADLRPELVTAIRNHIKKYKLEDVESSLQICCETTSTTKKTGLFTNDPKTTITGMIVTAQLLIWTNGKKRDKTRTGLHWAWKRPCRGEIPPCVAACHTKSAIVTTDIHLKKRFVV